MPKPLRFLIMPILCIFTLTACRTAMPEAAGAPLPSDGQTAGQLHLPDSEPVPQPQAEPEPQQGRMIGAWIPYFTVEQLLSSPDTAACRSAVNAYLQGLKKLGVNTVFVHVCAFGESSYPSAYYPLLPAAHHHDAMQIFTDICASLGLSLHAWINPLRLQTEEYMNAQTGDSTLSVWYRDAQMRAENLAFWEGRYFLDPSADSTVKFLRDVVTELVSKYHPAGVHIDDYFYPTAEPAFDVSDFAASGAAELSAWRRGNITRIVQTMCEAVHAADPAAVFSVSPGGNPALNYNTLFADVAAWAASGNCCDLLIPQLYFGYQNAGCPFAATMQGWYTMPRAENVQIAAGLAPYKIGQADIYAGGGSEEWITTSGIIARQAADVLAQPDGAGIVFYHSDALLQMPEAETAALDAVLRGQ